MALTLDLLQVLYIVIFVEWLAAASPEGWVIPRAIICREMIYLLLNIFLDIHLKLLGFADLLMNVHVHFG
jgi:hypothetical protein